MLFDTKTMIPEVYRKSRDMQVLNKLFDIIMTLCKYNIDNIGDVYDAMKCPEEFLPYFGETLNYKYNYSDTVTANRRTIKTFTNMEKWRGSERGLKIATALGLTSLAVSQDNDEISIVESDMDYLNALKSIHITYDYEQGLIQIDYPNTYTLVRYLLDYVRPVGVGVELRSVTDRNINTDVMLIYADTENRVREYNPTIDSGVERSFVNFSSVGDESYYQHIIDQWQQNISNNDTFSFNGGE